MFRPSCLAVRNQTVAVAVGAVALAATAVIVAVAVEVGTLAVPDTMAAGGAAFVQEGAAVALGRE